jgi:hypothetical protein
MRIPKAVAALAMGMLLSASALHAQGVEFSLGGGIDLPLGDFDDVAKLGFHGLAGVSIVPTNWPVGIQVDGNYSQFKLDRAGDLKTKMLYGTANLVYKFKTSEESRFRPYLIGGGGVYNVKTNGNDDIIGDVDESDTKFGINAGAGFDFKAGSAGLFIEGRFHNVFTPDNNTTFIPITIGVRLGGH